MAYQVQAQVGGKLAQVGSRLIDGAACKVADDFFTAFTTKLAAQQPVMAATFEPEAVPAPAHYAAASGPWLARNKGRAFAGVVVAAVVVWYVAIRMV